MTRIFLAGMTIRFIGSRCRQGAVTPGGGPGQAAASPAVVSVSVSLSTISQPWDAA